MQPHSGFLQSYLLFHESVLVAVNIQIPSATELKTCLCVAFGIEFEKLHSVLCEMCEYEKAYNEYMKMADNYRSRGYGVEADMAEKDAEEVKNKHLSTISFLCIL